jgi:uncharacterized caspase-like protein
MITRRTFVKSLSGLPALLMASASGSTAVDDESKVCLIVGNGAYPHMRLRNPVNDAQAMNDLCKAAGFSVFTRLDATRYAFAQAIEQFGEAVQRANTKLAVFYYAGHGAQLEWRNYLLPVDAYVSNADELKARCIDLSSLLSKFANTKDRTHVVILDCCRNDPFGGSYRPAQAGLSQFDAPVGSLLAYSTAPGSVALDGEGNNGLYTKNLVRELSRHDTRLEDALKRVRLNVRLESKGAQIPWESTSLETDVYFFDEGRKQLSDAELEESIKEDLAAWERIKSSHDAQDWIAYLRRFPNGRFAEIAQGRLTRLLATQESRPAVTASANVASEPPATPAAHSQSSGPVTIATTTPAVPAASNAVPPTSGSAQPLAPKSADAPAILIAPGAAVPKIGQSSGNPYSAGVYPLGRVFTVGDEASFRVTDVLTGVPKSTYRVQITSVDIDADRIEGNNGRWVFDSMGNILLSPGGGQNSVPPQTVPAELQVGKKWSAAWIGHAHESGERFYKLDLTVMAREVVRVAQVDFDAFRVDSRGVYTTRGNLLVVRLDWRQWIVPGLIFPVKGEYINRIYLPPISSDRVELVTLRQQTIDLSMASRDEPGTTPNGRSHA